MYQETTDESRVSSVCEFLKGEQKVVAPAVWAHRQALAGGFVTSQPKPLTLAGGFVTSQPKPVTLVKKSKIWLEENTHK